MEKITVKKVCVNCNKCIEIDVPLEGITKYNMGMHVQEAFPDLTPGEREMFITGLCDDCFKEIFKDEEP